MTDDMTDWLTVPDAARRLGKSERTIRRWMASGRLPIRDTPDGKMVGISGAPSQDDRPPGDTGQAAPDTTGIDIAGLRRELDRRQAEIDKLTALLTEVSGERDYLRQAHAAALGKIPAQLAATVEAGRSWWKFWRR